jgi:hypothetical protein
MSSQRARGLVGWMERKMEGIWVREWKIKQVQATHKFDDFNANYEFCCVHTSPSLSFPRA